MDMGIPGKSFCVVITLTVLLCNDALCMGGAREMIALQEILLKDYKPKVRPSRTYHYPTNVSTQLCVSAVMDLNTRQQTLDTKAFLRLNWMDEFLQWEPSDHGNITEVQLPQNDVWVPDILIYNTANDFDYLGGQRVSVSANGSIRWDSQFHLLSMCKLDVTKYPFDENVCPIDVIAWTHDNTTVNLTWPSLPVDLHTMMINGQFEISPEAAEKFLNLYDNQYYNMLRFKLKLKRRPAHAFLTLLIPITLLSVLSLLSFILSPGEPEKLTLSITCLLSFTVFLDVVDKNMPETSDNISLLVIYVTSSLALAFLGVVGNIAVNCVQRWDENKEEASTFSDQNYLSVDLAKAANQKRSIGSCQQEEDRSEMPSPLTYDHPDASINHSLNDARVRFSQPAFMSRAQKLNSILLFLNCVLLVLIIVVIGSLMV